MQAKTVIGIGASAGGLEALERLFDGTRPDGKSAYVVVTHLSPDFKSLLDELLKRHTVMPVCVVEEGMDIEADVVYVIPPNTEMIVIENTLHLSDRGRSPAQTLPINIFFSSLAKEYGPDAIAVILSGSGSDGAKGAEEVRLAGGSVIVQDPETARFDSMPRAAIAACINARVAKAETIGTIIGGRSGNALSPPEPEVTDVDVDQRASALSNILQLIYGASTVDFSLYKMTTIYRRVRRRMLSNGHDTLEDYLLQLKGEPGEVTKLADDLLITVTEFFRDKEAFAFLEKEIVPDLVAKSKPSQPIRVWISACSYGQEAYSIAILLYMEAQRQGVRIDPQIYATDLREASIQHAGAGIYTARELASLPENARDECFEQIAPEEYRIIQPIRRWLVFAQHNMLRDPPFTRLDFASCRNVLIYFEPEAQKKALSLLNFGLRDQGILFLGRSESLGELSEDFQTIDQPFRIFRKTGASAAVQISIGARLAAIEGASGGRHSYSASSIPVAFGKQRLGPAYAALIDAFIPQGALISNNREVLHLFGDADDFLRAPKGVMDADVLKMAPLPLRVPIAAALDRARDEGREIVFPRLTGPFEDDTLELTIRVVPLRSAMISEIKYFFIGIERTQSAKPVLESPALVIDATALESDRISGLERELTATRENLQATIEEVETSNEELQSTNEELMASNEELQSTNEELQSVNEELYTVNGEYQKKNDELENVTRDIDNLIASTSIGVIFVDDQLHMRRFTDAVARVLNIAPIDIGRALPDITHRLVGFDFAKLIREALDERRIKSSEARDQNDDWWQVRVIPIAAKMGRGDGAVITIYEITELREAQIAVEDRTHDLHMIAELTGAHVIRQKPDGSFASAQPGWSALSGQRDEDSTNFGWMDAAHSADRDRLMQFWRKSVPSTDEVIQTHIRLRDPKGEDHRHLTVLSSPEFGEEKRHQGWVSVLIDIEDAVQSEHVVRDSEQILHTILHITPSRISYVDTNKRYSYVNQAYEDAFGIKREEIISRRIDEVVTPAMYEQIEPHVDRALLGETTEYTMHGTMPGGETEILHVHYQPDIRSDGSVAGLAVSTRDITDAFQEIDDQLQQKAVIADVIAQSSLSIFVLTDVNEVISYASSGAARITGFSTFDLRQKTLSDLLPEYDGERLEKLIERQAHSVDESGLINTFLINNRGDSVDIEFELVTQPGSAPGRIIAFMRDRTNLSSRETALRRRTEELSRSNRMLEVFAAAATHELTSPLRRVAKFSQLLQSDYSRGMNDEASEFLDVIVGETDRMRRTIDTVVELVRLERAEFGSNAVDTRAVADMAHRSVMDMIEAANADIDIEALPPVLGDPTQLEILFRNLLSNALIHKHPERTPSIRVEGKKTDRNQVEIRIIDNGKGVTDERRSDIFLPFVRFDGNRDSIGMGLALCRRICEAHDGALELEQTSPEGSTFLVRLRSS